MSKVNTEAQKERHQKLYEGQYHSFAGKVWFHTKRLIRKVWLAITPSRKQISDFMHPLDHMPAPKRLYTQLAIWSIGLLVLTSMNVSHAAYSGGLGVGQEYADLALEISGTFVSDEEGYIIKNMPLEGEAIYDQNRIAMIDHEVQSGETLSVIAYRYGVSVSSIRYANSALSNSDYLKVGQTIKIPPKTGLYVEVESGDSVIALVEEYKGNLDETKFFNDIEGDDDLIAGDEVFIVDGEPKIVYVASTYTYTGSDSSYQPDVMQYDMPVSAEGWIIPTQGGITQGYHAGHYAYDIADRSKPPVLAAASGTITKASSGTWGGGYGNHVIIDHGNGYQTLYAHLETVYVNTGDYVSQGQVIGKMGNTGRVYGATGIHLHFELTYNGVKQNPSIMGVW